MSMIPGCSWGINVINPCDSQGGLSDAAKAALLECFAHVAWADEHGQDYYDALYDALYSVTPGATLDGISAVFEQGGAIIYDTDSLDSLKQYLTVTAYWSDGSQTNVSSSSYTLSGTLTAGTSTITCTYLDKTDTFTVTVTSLTIVDEDVIMDGYTHTLVSGGINYDTTATYSFVYTFGTHTPVSGASNRAYGPLTSANGNRDGAIQFINSSSEWRAQMGGIGKVFTPADGDVLCYVHNFVSKATKIYLNGTLLYSDTVGPSYYANTEKIVIQPDAANMTVAITHIKVAQGDLH